MISFDNSYARLPERFYTRIDPARVAAPKLLRLNAPLARQLGLDPEWLASPDGVAMLAGAAMPEGAASLALVYAGHQFGHFSPQLGDGRALLVGEFEAPDGQRYDLHLKGSGRTPYSRGGDGRAAVGPVLREYVVSEAMAALGVPTSRTLAAVATGERVFRERILPGAVLARVAKRNIRVGTFVFAAAGGDGEGVKALADYAIQRHDPAAAEAAQPYRAFLDGVVARTADLIARWMAVGFIHGVMNTDNMSIAGETIDYGPCAFMDDYHPATVFSSIDHQGRYAYANQPRIAHWNMARLAQALAPLLGEREDAAVASAQAAIDAFAGLFEDAYLARMRAKIGLETAMPDDASLIDGLLAAMANRKADFTSTFRHLAEHLDEGPVPDGLDAWVARWRERLAAEGRSSADMRARMDAVNPLYIPRNHLVEEALAAAENDGDLEPLDRLLGAVKAPFAPQANAARYAAPPLPHEIVEATFCGT
jgi:uncharacterized protein YdiU (UPF0061 family)